MPRRTRFTRRPEQRLRLSADYTQNAMVPPLARLPWSNRNDVLKHTKPIRLVKVPLIPGSMWAPLQFLGRTRCRIVDLRSVGRPSLPLLFLPTSPPSLFLLSPPPLRFWLKCSQSFPSQLARLVRFPVVASLCTGRRRSCTEYRQSSLFSPF